MEDSSTGGSDEARAVDVDASTQKQLRRRDVLAAGGVTAAAAVAGCLGFTKGPSDTDSSSTTDTTMPSVTYLHNFRYISKTVSVPDGAEEEGLWTKEGIDVDFQTTTGAKKAAKAVASGKAEFGNGDYGTITQMINKGAPLTIIGHIHYPLDGVVAKGDWLDRFKDLEGKVVGQYDPEKPRLKEAIRRDGGDPSKVEWQTVSPGAATKLLVTGKVDAAAAYWPPNLIRLQNRGYEASALSTAEKLNYMGLALYGHRDVVENKPDLTNSFVRGQMNAWKWGANNPDEVAKVYRAAKNISKEEYQKQYQDKWFGYYLASILPARETAMSEGFGWVDKDRLQQTLNLYTEIDIIDEAKPVDEYLNLGWIEQNKELAIDTAEAILTRLDEDYPFGTDEI